MKETEKRRSDRVSLSIPIEVMSTDVSGEYFTEHAKTTVLSCHGATIIVNRKLAPNQEVLIRRPATNKEAECRVVGQIGGQAGAYVYGVELLDSNENLWGIEFPPPPEPGEAVGRALLQCGGCGNQQVTYLNELELEVFQASLAIALYCKHCRDTTYWKEADFEPRREPKAAPLPLPPTGVVDAGPEAPGVVGVEEQPRTQNERKHLRVRTTIRACIRHAGFQDEVVGTENVSRGGFCFKSPREYVQGSKIDVALPYTPGPANIFVPGRIVRSRAIRSAALFEYGVAYIKHP